MKKTSRIIIYALCLLLVVGLFAGCGQNNGQQAAKDGEKEVLVIGTSPDYPPFEFVDEKGDYAGFDMDLAQEIGKKLGMEVKIEALEFDSLIASLQKGKIDAIISCMSSSPERLKEADFSEPYLETKQGVLAKPDADVKIEKLDDVLNYEFGVQTGTTMDEWATSKVKDGTIKDEQVKRYTDANVAALDVKNGRLKVLVMDLPVAKAKAKELDLKVLIECKLEQDEDPAVVLAKGNDELLEKINNAIKELKEDGTIQKLENKWLSK